MHGTLSTLENNVDILENFIVTSTSYTRSKFVIIDILIVIFNNNYLQIIQKIIETKIISHLMVIFY